MLRGAFITSQFLKRFTLSWLIGPRTKLMGTDDMTMYGLKWTINVVDTFPVGLYLQREGGKFGDTTHTASALLFRDLAYKVTIFPK